MDYDLGSNGREIMDDEKLNELLEEMNKKQSQFSNTAKNTALDYVRTNDVSYRDLSIRATENADIWRQAADMVKFHRAFK